MKRITLLTITLTICVLSVNAQVMVKDFSEGNSSSYFRSLTNANGTLYVVEPISGLWKSDGTELGTVSISKHLPASITSANGISYYIAAPYFAASGRYSDVMSLWRYDGAAKASSVKTVKEFPPGWVNFSNIINVNGILFFYAFAPGGGPNKLWKSDGTAQGTVIVSSPSAQVSGNLINFNDTLFFTSWDPTHGDELWKTDGKQAGTVMVKDINAVYTSTGDTGSSQPRNSINVNGTLFFTADDGIHGRELWKSDGTEAGTVMVKDIEVGSMSSFMEGVNFASVNGILYFSALSNENVLPHYGVELWRSDGTARGTVMVKDINPRGDSSSPYELTNVNGTLFFAANDGIHGTELWKSNGTAAGTVMVKDINVPPPDRSQYANSTGSIAPPGNLAIGPSSTFTNANGVLYFCADDGTHGAELWKSDGTATGTVMVKDIKPFGRFGSDPRNLIYVNGVLFFTADDGPHGNELWEYDVPMK